MAPNVIFLQSLPDRPGEFGQVIHVFSEQLHRRMIHQEEPIAAPRHISANFAVAWDVHWYICLSTVTWHILNSDLAGFMERCGHCADRRLDLMRSGIDFPKIAERGDQSDSSMYAHSQIADVIEVNGASNAFRRLCFAQKR